MLGRLLCTVALGISAMLFPWWVALLLTLASLFYFKNFYEAVLIGLLLDAMYATHVFVPAFPYLLTLVTLVLVVLVSQVRSRMIMY